MSSQWSARANPRESAGPSRSQGRRRTAGSHGEDGSPRVNNRARRAEVTAWWAPPQRATDTYEDRMTRAGILLVRIGIRVYAWMSFPPNIVYLHSHDTGRYVQPYGHPVPTPNIQR